MKPARKTTSKPIRGHRCPSPYSKSKGMTPFDWIGFLNKAIINPSSITLKKQRYVKNLSSSWVTCACGNQCSIIPRSVINDNPLDTTLYTLGQHFCEDIGNQSWVDAKTTLTAIENRATILIDRELVKRKKKKSNTP